MTLRSASLLGFVGSLLVTILTACRFVISLLNHFHGLIPPTRVVSLFVETFAWLTVAIFFFVFIRRKD